MHDQTPSNHPSIPQIPHILWVVMASSTQTVVEEDLVEVEPPLADPSRVGERADLLDRDGQRSSWPDMINKATEINLNIGGLEVSFRIGVVILLGLVLCIVFIARWPTSSSPTDSRRSDAPTLDLPDLSPVNVSTAEDARNSYTTISLENRDIPEFDSSKTPSAQAMSTSSPAIAGFSNRKVSQVLEKAIQGLRYPTDQNETIEELQALNRELILKAHQQAVKETVQTLMQMAVRLIAWISVAVASADPVYLVLHLSLKALLRRSLSVVQQYRVEYAFEDSISRPFKTRVLLHSIYLGSAIYFLCKEQRTAGDVTIIAGCGMSLLLSVLSRSSAARKFWHRLCYSYHELDEFFLYLIDECLFFD